jgi:hypothetical protein
MPSRAGGSRRVRAGLALLCAVVGLAFGGPAFPETALGQESRAPERRGIRPASDLWGAIEDFGRDTWLVTSSPARLDARSGAELTGVLTVGAFLFVHDERIQERVLEGPSGGLGEAYRDLGTWAEPISLQSNTNFIYATTAVAAYLTGQDWLQAPAKQLLYSQWIGGLGRQIAGRIVGRERPNEVEDAYVFGDGTSFPSGHAAVAMEIAYVLSHHIGWWPASVALYGVASAVVYERVYSNSHWASDAWLGAAWGLAVARVVVATEESDRLTVRPDIDPRSGRAGVVVSVSVR